ncbi:UDP-N-acetylglucosamine 2-epimerase [Weissella confusa]|uniref:UDP-N-acetylglucosamine 2-epimerase n=1 Tax=Weissella confusa TaxID=1583 RepID=UPI0022DFFCCD|nr:UDP-N-acetylglucosamine 2-epimerase [Weissella confusa]
MYNILYVTGSRADFGIVEPLLQELNAKDEYVVDIVATGMQVEERFGNTVNFVRESGLKVISEIPMSLSDSSDKTSLKGLAYLTLGLVSVFESKRYDAVIILGDRYEMLAVANAAILYRVPIIHLHGGEQTLGNFDESIRHALTKLSNLHLASTEEYRTRIIQMGEEPESVLNIGALGVQNVLMEERPSFDTVKTKYGLDFDIGSYIVVLFHPETYLPEESIKKQAEAVRKSLEALEKDIILIGSNVDTGSDVVLGEFSKLEKNVIRIASLPTGEFHTLIENAYALLGNSSSGLIEAPSLGTVTVNLGNRQKGRAFGPSVIQVPTITEAAITEALKIVPSVTSFFNPYYQPNSVELATVAIDKYMKTGRDSRKKFFDIPFSI